MEIFLICYGLFLILFLAVMILLEYRYKKKFREALHEWEKVRQEAEGVLKKMNLKPFGTSLGSSTSK
jgi:hypothetical protein